MFSSQNILEIISGYAAKSVYNCTFMCLGHRTWSRFIPLVKGEEYKRYKNEQYSLVAFAICKYIPHKKT